MNLGFKKIYLALLVLSLMSCSSIVRTTKSYEHNTTVMHGHLAMPKNLKEKRPGILVVHEWWGNNDYSKMRADMLAELGYVALAVDMYGNATTVETPTEAGALAGGIMKNPKEAKARFEKALETLKSNPNVDSTKIAAVGYCFGGGVIFGMLEAGVKLDGAVSFHGSLKHVKSFPKNMKTKMLVLNGASDPMVPLNDVIEFKKIAEKNKVEMKLINYPDALHAFSNKRATEIGKKFNIPVAYNEMADKESWNEMKFFLGELFSGK